MTVSRYLKDPTSVASKTGVKIKEAIDRLGYIPSRAPVMLSQSASKTIGLAVSSFSNLLFSDLIDGIEERARMYGYDILLAHTSYLEEEEERKVTQLLSYQVDAMILTECTHTPTTIKRLKSADIPVVELMSIADTPIDMNIGYNHVKVAFAAVKGLIQSGRKCIAYLGARGDNRTLDRQYGYELACKEMGVNCHVFGADVRSNFSRGSAMMRQAVEELHNLDAVFCTNDDVAIGAMIACIDLGIKVPEQVAVLGYNGLNIGTATVPKLTSVVSARKEMGRMAIDLIMRRIQSTDNGEQRIELNPMLSRGDSLNKEEHTNISRILDTLYAVKLPVTGPNPYIQQKLQMRHAESESKHSKAD